MNVESEMSQAFGQKQYAFFFAKARPIFSSHAQFQSFFPCSLQDVSFIAK